MDSSAIVDFDSFDEPFRVRSNTWPQRPSREIEQQNSPVSRDDSSNGGDQQGNIKDPLGLTTKKSGSRRNAWGNLSYADLITTAIQSSPEKRLTLSQIYDWMVQNVPYFKDKGDSTSSAGWKNSIRHNLSLHSRFMRIQNEGTGKSSWWVLNPDAKPGKTPRRRAGSMETKCYEKKRGRIRKKVEALRASLENGGTLSPGGCDDYFDGFGDFRPRAGSSTSNCSRLSPISAVAEPDIGSGDIQQMSSIHWNSEVSNSPTLYNDNDLVESLVEAMKLSNHDSVVSGVNGSYISDNSSDYSQPSSYGGVSQSSPGIDSQYTQLSAPPPYPTQQQQKQQQQINGVEFHPLNFNTTQNFNNALRLQIGQLNGSTTFTSSEMYNSDYSDSVLSIKQETLSPVHMATPSSLSINTQQRSCSEQGSPNSGSFAHHSPQRQSGLQPQAIHVNNGLPPHARHISPQQSRHLIQQQPVTTTSLQQQALHQAACDSILREALTTGAMAYRSQVPANTPSPTFSAGNHTPVNSAPASNCMSNGMPGIRFSSNLGLHHQTLTSAQLCGISGHFTDSHAITRNGSVGNCNVGVPLDIDMDLMGVSVLDYDMDQVIKHELSLEGNLDFMFDAGPATSVSQNVVH